MTYEGLLRFNDTRPIRDHAWQDYQACGLPRRNQDRWKYTPLAQLREAEFSLERKKTVAPLAAPSMDPEKDYQLVFEDGVFIGGNLPANVSLIELDFEPGGNDLDAQKKILRTGILPEGNGKSSLASGRMKAIDFEESPEHLALAAAPHLYCLKVEHSPGTEQDAGSVPLLNIVFQGSDTTNRQCLDTLGATSLSYHLSERARLRVIERVRASAMVRGGLLHQQIDISKYASLRKVCMYDDVEPLHMSSGGSWIAEEGEFHNIALYHCKNGGYHRHHHKACLTGKNAVYRGVGFTQGTQKDFIDWQWSINHMAPDTVSYQQVRNVLGNHAQAAFHGSIFIAKKCPGSEGYQEVRGLLRDKTAVHHCIPALKIFTDAVKCSHGAVVSPLAQDALYYMTSRGITKSMAEQMLIEGFFREIANDIYEDTLPDGGAIYSMINKWLSDSVTVVGA